ncbi:hypothetical protein GCM10009839_04300 [Catenulispora yoronensis]|uniref:WXG100 family type VII secretion target n=1 Tax=Catenulispora yoronensis TaxID=450799 RepID=A0ABN2TKR1_9ACTN
MADHIAIKTSDLENIATTLTRLIGEFQDAGKTVDHYSGAMGSGRMADTLHEFATNWDVHKKKLLEQLQTLQSAADQSAKTWDGLDQDLAKALTDASKKEG